MSTPIPEDVMIAAQDVVDTLSCTDDHGHEWQLAIARALLARDERAAKIAEQSGSWVAESDDGGGKVPSKGVWHGLTAPEIASAIRDRSKT